MKVLKDNEYKLIEQLFSLTQAGVKKTMSMFLKPKYKNFVETNHYIYAEGDIPIALVAHMDTVFPRGAEEVLYDRQKNVMISPTGLGADDRAGIYAIIQIVRSGLRPHIILTTDEEKGAIGASALVQDCPTSPFKDLRYIVQLDRRGADDCVFYDCLNQAFTDYIENFGFVENLGSFSDISVIAPAWKVAAVNLSIGYRDEHSTSETLFVGQMLNTIRKVTNMLREKDIPSFEYIPAPKRAWYHRLPAEKNRLGRYKCHKCHARLPEEELIEVKEKGSCNFVHYCIDCIGEDVEWCRICGEPYQKDGLGDLMGICEDCYYDQYYYNY